MAPPTVGALDIAPSHHPDFYTAFHTAHNRAHKGPLATVHSAGIGFPMPVRGSVRKKLTRVAAPSPRASLGRRTVCGRIMEQLSAAGFEALRN